VATKTRSPSRRQGIRQVLLALSFIAFPVTINYFSPYLIVVSSFEGVVNGSTIVFASLFACSLLFGRLWCGWGCPAAELQESLRRVNNCRVGHRIDLAKWLIWVPWVALIVFGVVRAGGYSQVDPLFMTPGGISTVGTPDRPIWAAYAVYFLVVLVFFGLALLLGRRGGCHSICWMAPFMILGRKVRNALGGWPSLRLVSEPSACRKCDRCTLECPMSIDVQERVLAGSMEDPECVLCGACVDSCPSKAIHYSFSAGR
jgi:ferredoxin-type protein NapH